MIGATVLFGLSIAFVHNAQQWRPNGPSLTALIPGVQPNTPKQTAPDVRNPDSAGSAPLDSAQIRALQQAEGLEELRPLQPPSTR